jgi:hypothetical protein
MHYTPTLNIMETSRNIRNFVNANKSTLFEIFRPFAPYIVGLMLIDTIITLFMQKSGSAHQFQLGHILSGYFLIVLIITWHRVVIHGPDNYERMNPFKPKKSEWIFMGMWIFLSVATVVICVVVGAVSIMFGAFSLIIALTGLLIGAIYIGYKVCFYFPARAVNSSITLKQSFSLTKGYIWKLVGATFMASLKTLGLLFLYMLFVVISISVTGYIFGAGVITHIVGFLLALPTTLYFQPLLTAYGVTGLSNYYMHAMQNKAEAHRSA